MTRHIPLGSPFPMRESTELGYNVRTPLAIGAIAGTLLTSCGTSTPAVIDTPTVDSTSSVSSSTSSEATVAPSSNEQAHQYRDGTYATVAHYRAPSGEETINVSITLQNDVITDATYAGTATVGKSARYQQAFGEGYKQYVIGKKMDDLALDVVSGASLTTKGFTTALSQVKGMAQ